MANPRTRTFEIRELSEPTLTDILRNRDLHDGEDPETVVDITGYSFNLMVKNNIDDDDTSALVDLAGTLPTPLGGVFAFTLTIAHTGMVPGRTYFAEIRFWGSGVATTEPPTGVLPVVWKVSQRVSRIN